MTISAPTASTSSLPMASIAADAAPLAGRVLLAGLFLVSGYGKLLAPTMTIGYIQSVGLPVPELSYAMALLVELVGGLALIVGFQTRLVALAMAVFTVATAVTFHNNLADLDQYFHFFKNISIAGGLLQIVAFGAGRFSLDARR